MKRFNLRLFSLALCASSFLPPLVLAKEVIITPHVEARFLPEKDILQPGEENWFGLHLKIIPGWHTYWRNPGDSGIPISIKWNLPEGVIAGEILWPYPRSFSIPPLMNYGYEKEVLLPFKITLSDKVDLSKAITIQAKVDWLVCEETCIPEGGELSLQILAANRPAVVIPGFQSLFDRARAEIPRDNLDIRAFHSDRRIIINLGKNNLGATHAEFFAISEGVVKYPSPQKLTKASDGTLEVSTEKDDNFTLPPKGLAGVIVLRDVTRNFLAAFQFHSSLEKRSDSIEWWKILLFAFVGGAILNLMPCVFPILAIKVLSVLKNVKISRRETIIGAFLYSVGVVVSFLLLATILLALRSAGEVLGWGFHLQSPTFIFFLLSLMFLMSLNFLGFFEIGASWMGLGDQLTRGNSRMASFFTGVLAVIVATPCTAPFMGTAIGVALTQPALLMLLVFFFLGLGMAIPYFLLASSPSFAKLLPKPGPWMATFKEFLSFPLLLTCVWLLWVFHQQTGELGLAWALVGLISIVFGLWLAKKVKSGAKAKLIVLTSLILGGLIGVGWQSGAKDKASSNEISWEKFSPEAVAKAQKDGRNIFIDFTADWCITCKVNERVVFGNENVLQALKAQNVLLLKADWTKRDPQITEELARHGRAGVPLYLLYKPESANPEILPQVLTPSAFLEALQ